MRSLIPFIVVFGILMYSLQVQSAKGTRRNAKKYSSKNWIFDELTETFKFQCEVTYDVQTLDGDVARTLSHLGDYRAKMGKFQLGDRCFKCGRCVESGVWCRYRKC